MAQKVVVAEVSELPENGDRVLVEIDGAPVAVFNVGGQFFCIADVCSHDDGPVAEGELDGFAIECPRHGARFDIRTGKVLSMPAVTDIPVYPVTVANGEISVEMP